jgi:hypothetical protein
MARNSQFLYADALGAALATATRWLDLGCGHQFVPDWVPAEAIERRARQIYVAGVDADLASLRRHTGLSQRIGCLSPTAASIW